MMIARVALFRDFLSPACLSVIFISSLSPPLPSFLKTKLLCSPGCRGACVDQASLKLTEICLPLPLKLKLGLKVHTGLMPGYFFVSFIYLLTSKSDCVCV